MKGRHVKSTVTGKIYFVNNVSIGIKDGLPVFALKASERIYNGWAGSNTPRPVYRYGASKFIAAHQCEPFNPYAKTKSTTPLSEMRRGFR